MKKNIYKKKIRYNGKLIRYDTPVVGIVLECVNRAHTKYDVVKYRRKDRKTTDLKATCIGSCHLSHPIYTLEDLDDLDFEVKMIIQDDNKERGIKGNTSYKIRGDLFDYLFD